MAGEATTMNKTQKSAWLCLFAILLGSAVLAYLGLRIFVLHSLPHSHMGRSWPMIALLTFIGLTFVLMRRKQSPVEPEGDERDKAIMRNAILVSFVSTWLFLAVATLISALILGEAGSVPVYILTFINVGVLLLAMLVYSVAVLVQYGEAQKGEQE
jgi:Zn-dependent protease